MVQYNHVMNNLLEETKQYVQLDYAYQFYNEELFNNELEGCLITLNRQKNTAGYLIYEQFVNRDPSIQQKYIHELCLNPDYFYYQEKEVMQTLVHEQCHLWKFMFGNKKGRRTYHDKEWGDKMESIGLMPSHNGKVDGKKTGQKMQDYVIPGGLFEIATEKLLSQRKIILFKYFPIWSSSFVIPPIIEENSQGNSVLVTSSLPEVPTMGSYITQEGFTIKVKETDEDGNIVLPNDFFDPEGQELFVKIPQATKYTQSKIKYRCYNCDINLWGRPGLRIRCEECNSLFDQVG